ncbi:hypothetical protein D9757_002709 [Collybiopsis confluens]|uniref:Pyrimidine 5-nucleotidase n=1 Tax=Collybiopsis confluens TaxID=2823264 RepID=A0A8H5HWD5_9AGAR|nr:hypothetical protein D9757_002709 [Collybiopsis confluens]
MSAKDERPVIWFDIDNTLYSTSARISQVMGVKIHGQEKRYKPSCASLSLPSPYYSEYGLALAGLVRHHNVDPLDFDKNCDQALPLEEMIFPNPAHRQLLQDIDRSKVRVWALTNAYKIHAERVLRILNLRDQIEEIVYCDYAAKDLTSKPDPAYYRRAMTIASVSEPSQCYFIDDNRRNVEAAHNLGWNCIHFVEVGLEHVEGGKVNKISEANGSAQNKDTGIQTISQLEQLREVWGEFFLGVDRNNLND